MDQTIVQLLGDKSLSKIMEDASNLVLSREADEWADFPPDDFINFISAYPSTPFDQIPDSENYIKPPTFLIAQAHRLWQTSFRVQKHLIEINSKRMIDLGSFPFFLPFILRDYFGYKGEILTTTNLSLSTAELEFLAAKNIKVCKLDLDPYVNDPTAPRSDWLPIKLDLADNSVDFILASHVIEHLYHPRFLLKETYRLLRPGGKFMISTDNAMMLDVFTNYIGGYGYIFEPIENTAALNFHFWRGHVRFFTEQDLTKLLLAENFKIDGVEFFHCFYEVFYKEYFKTFEPTIQAWKKSFLRDTDWLRNDISIVGIK